MSAVTAAPSASGASRAARTPAPWARFDGQLLLYVVLLVGVGVVMSHSASFGEGATPGLSQTARTLIWAAIGFILLFVVASLDYRWLRRLAVPIYVGVIGLLALTLVAGSSANGPQLSVTILGLDFQFSEIGKVLMLAVVAAVLVARRDRVRGPGSILLATAVMSAPAALVLAQPDLGTAAVFVAVLVGMLFLAGVSVPWLVAFSGVGAAATPLLLDRLQAYQRDRLLCFLDPSTDPQGACFQVVQSLGSVGAGGLLGRGLSVGGEGPGGRVPVETTDFIFTVVAEDLGFVGGAVVLVLFALLLWRVILIAWHAADPFGTLVAGGVATVIAFQVAVNVGMVLNVMPVTGVPLPFITYGGSSLISLLFALGITQSIRIRSVRGVA